MDASNRFNPDNLPANELNCHGRALIARSAMHLAETVDHLCDNGIDKSLAMNSLEACVLHALEALQSPFKNGHSS